VENFRLIENNLLCFDLDVVDHNSIKYIVLRNGIYQPFDEEFFKSQEFLEESFKAIHDFLSFGDRSSAKKIVLALLKEHQEDKQRIQFIKANETTQITSSAISELCKLDPQYSERLLHRLKQSLINLKKHTDSCDEPPLALNAFINICRDQSFMITAPIYYGSNQVCITHNLIDDIDTEINCRLNLITKLQNGLFISIGKELIQEIQPVGSDKLLAAFERNEKHMLLAGEIDEREWFEICKVKSNTAGLHVNNKPMKLSKAENPRYDFSRDILNEQGRSIINELKEKYSGQAPKYVAAMLKALEQSKLLKANLNTFAGMHLVAALNEFLPGRTYSQQAIFYSRKEASTNEHIENAVRDIKVFLKKT
jgi:hypothetical protein